MPAELRVVSWNIHYVVGQAARAEGDFLASLRPKPDIVLLQEANRHSAEDIRAAAGLDWLRLAVDLRKSAPDEGPARRRGVAIGARTAEPLSFGLLHGAPFPERAMHGVIRVGPHGITVASYHAPPGVTYKRLKPKQAVQFAKWLTTLQGQVLLGADANTPRIDHPDFELVRTHWHMGSRRLKGGPGDDLLWGPRKIHELQDALRLWLQGHPAKLKRLRSTCPTGPLAVSLYTGRRIRTTRTDGYSAAVRLGLGQLML